MDVPDHLRQAVRQGRAVTFVGAGVSRSVRTRQGESLFPSWAELIAAGAAELEASRKSKEAALVNVMLSQDAPDYVSIANTVTSALGPLWFTLAKNRIDRHRGECADDSLRLARLAWAIGGQLVITTNWDRVLEWACPNPDDVRSIDSTCQVELASLHEGEHRPTVWHIHGHIDAASGLVFTEEKYRQVYGPDAGNAPVAGGDLFEAARRTLSSIMTARTVVFLGFSMDDAFLVRFLKDVVHTFAKSTGPHYALLPMAEADRARGLLAGTNVRQITYPAHGPPLLKAVADIASSAQFSLAGASHSPYRAFVIDNVYRLIGEGSIDRFNEQVSAIRKHFLDNGYPADAEIELVASILDRLAGSPRAVDRLRSCLQLPPPMRAVAAYELALQGFATKQPARVLQADYRDFCKTQILPIEIQSAWATLLCVAQVASEPERNSQLVWWKTSKLGTPTMYRHFTPYFAVQAAVAAAVCGDASQADAFLTAAKRMSSGVANDYPYARLVVSLNRAFVGALVGYAAPIEAGSLPTVRGHAHVVARSSRVLRQSSTGMAVIERLSRSWRDTDWTAAAACDRLRHFENELLSKAGTVFGARE